jgi:hypothetical protein
MGLRTWWADRRAEPDEYFPEIPVPTRVTAGQVNVARFWVERDKRQNRRTPEWVVRIAAVRLPDDPPLQPQT